jgi:branched-chain amino acid transport system substrate-binding protein
LGEVTVKKAVLLLAMVAASLSAGGSAAAAEKPLRIGFITTSSGGGALLGKHQKDGFDLAVEHLGGALGGLKTEIIDADDQQKPDVGLQAVKRMIGREKVDFVVGVIWSNVLMTIAKPVTDAGVFLISTNAGPSPLAGAQCNKNFFSTAYQNDEFAEATGKLIDDAAIDNLFLVAPNYQAGKDAITGLKRFYKKSVKGEMLTTLGQQDFQPELTQLRAASPGAVWIMQPGAMGVSFIKQWRAAGLDSSLPLYTTFTVNWATLPLIGDAALGSYHATMWTPEIDNSQNRRFVADYRKKFGYMPSQFSAQSYDAAFLIDSAVRAVHGNLDDRDALRAALRSAHFQSVRGGFKFNTNHFPIQNYYKRQVVRGDDGKPTILTKELLFKDHKDSYYQDCHMQ